MIRYDLVCSAGHGFEGWFQNSNAFADQVARRLIACPDCGGTEVHQALATPAVRAGGRNEAPVPQLPDAMVAALQKMRATIERTCENVGTQFADEAIRIERGEAPARGIYGEATAADRDRLEDAGVEVMAVPWVRRADG